MSHEISLPVKFLALMFVTACLLRPVAAIGSADISEDWLGGIPENNQLAYEIVRKDKRIGFQTLSFIRDDNNQLVVDVYIRIDLKFGFITLFRYIHANQEVWKEGALQSIVSKTYNNGDDEVVDLRLEGDVLQGKATKAKLPVRAPILTTSYFNPNFIRQNALLSTQDGRILNVEIANLGVDTVPTPDGTVDAVHYQLTGDLALNIWYTPAGQWVRTEFSLGNETIAIRPVKFSDLPPPASWKQP